MANTKLIKKLTEKWSQPDGMPGKGYELVREERGLSPCAQSEAIMLSKGMGVMDFQAFRMGAADRLLVNNPSLSATTAKTLGISVIHSILLRRFNDLSSLSPAIVLNEPERVLGENWDKVLEFWYFLSALSRDDETSLDKNWVNKVKCWEEFEDRKAKLKTLAESLDIIAPDLYYIPGVSSKPVDIARVKRQTEEETLKTNPGFKIVHTNNQQRPLYLPVPDGEHDLYDTIIVGDYSRAFFGWIATNDCMGGYKSVYACATNEIQTLGEGKSFEDLYFCKLLSYDPTKGNTLRKAQRKLTEYKQSVSDAVNRFYRISNNFIFSRFSNDPEVKREATKEMVEGVLDLSVDDVVNELAWKKIRETYEVGKGRFFGTLRIRVPKLGSDSEADKKFYELVKVLKQDYYVQPLSFCNLENSSSKEGSEWAISGKKEEIHANRRFNAPKGFNS
jgi:hypothetical protein